jgi:ribosomal protein L32
MRRSRAHDALTPKKLVVSKESGKKVMPHRVDPYTGMYKGVQVVKPKTTRTKRPAGKK